VWRHGRGKAAFDGLPLHHAQELPSWRRHDDTLCAVLAHIFSNIPERTVGTDRRRSWCHRQFHGGLGSRVQGCTVQQPEDDPLAIHDHTLVPTSCLDTLDDLTQTVVKATHRDIAPNDLPNRG